MAERQDQKDQGKEAGRESRKAGQRIEAATDKMAEAAGEAGRAGGKAVQQGMQIAGETVEHGTGAVAGTGERSMPATSEGTRKLIASTVDQVGELGQRMAETAQRTTEDLRTLMTMPSLARSGLEELREAVTGMMTRAVQVNVRATQEVFRFANPGALAEIQQRLAQQYLQGLIESSADMLRVSRRFADEALRPIEERTQRMQQGGSAQQRSGTVSDVMTPGSDIARPDQTVQEAAQLMAEVDTGALPVGENDRLVGIITGRDIATRVTAEGKDPKQTRVREVMTPGARYCFEDEDIGHVAENMAEQQVRRLPVVNRDKRLVGVVSLGDVSTREAPRMSGSALHAMSQRGGRRQHSAYAGDKPEQER